MRDLQIHGRARAGFTLVEVMVSITVLFLGVMTAGAVMVTIQRGANFTESRYRDYGDLRSQVENLKVQVSSDPTATGTLLTSKKKFQTSAGHDATTQYQLQANSLPNLIWVSVSVTQDNGAEPLQFMTYLRANDE
jgi:Tfp pilus assembly protein PilV